VSSGNTDRLAPNWNPRPARPGRDWSHTTLITETRRYVEARNGALNPPLQPEPPQNRMQVRVNLPAAARLRTLRQASADRRRRVQPVQAGLLFLGGAAVLALDVLSLRDAPDATFYLSFVFGLLLLMQGLRLLLRVRR